ncbi:MAG TPA: hypothetical protein VHV30_00290 [Polyangiaceae bacterium]|jgi:hypothetical protein|nr:hypothetical protein [Polyangiaceae bacterium]
MELPDREAIDWIVRTYAHLRAAHGEAIGDPALVQPTSEYFPDPFPTDGATLERLLQRVLSYAPVAADLRIELAIQIAEEGHAGGCGSAACGDGGGGGARDQATVEELDEGYRVSVAATDLGNPEVLTASLARSAGLLVLHEAGEPVSVPENEIAAVVCGFGVLLANGAAVWAKSCGGLRMAQATVLSVEELALALALFAATGEAGAGKARKHLGATQREAFGLAWDWVESNPRLVEALREAPATLESGALPLEPVRGVLGQWLHDRRARSLERSLRAGAAAAAAPPMTDEERQRRLERQERLREVSSLLDLPDR